MGFVELARIKNKKNYRIGFGSATDTRYELINGTKTLVKRPQKGFEGLQSYQEAFKEEYVKGFGLSHKNILAYRDFFNDNQGAGIIMESEELKSLGYILHEKPTYIADKKEVDRIIQEIINSIAYLHEHKILHLNLNLENILLTKEHTVKIINPVSFYLNCKPSILTLDGAFTAPELFSENGYADFRSDVYSIGKIISALFVYSPLPIKYRAIVKKATKDKQLERFQNIAQLQKAIKIGSFKQKITKISIFSSITIVIAGLVYMTILDFTDKDIHYVIPAKNSQHTLEIIKKNPIEYNIPNDSITNIITNEEIGERDIYNKKAVDIFKKQFAKKANPIISNIYSISNMNGEEKTFRSMSSKSFDELSKIQNELIKQYNIDPNEAAKLTQEVINNLTQQKMNELQRSKLGNNQQNN